MCLYAFPKKCRCFENCFLKCPPSTNPDPTYLPNLPIFCHSTLLPLSWFVNWTQIYTNVVIGPNKTYKPDGGSNRAKSNCFLPAKKMFSFSWEANVVIGPKIHAHDADVRGVYPAVGK